MPRKVWPWEVLVHEFFAARESHIYILYLCSTKTATRVISPSQRARGKPAHSVAVWLEHCSNQTATHSQAKRRVMARGDTRGRSLCILKSNGDSGKILKPKGEGRHAWAELFSEIAEMN